MLLVNRNYARLWASQAVSVVGDFVFDTTLVLWIGTVLLHDRPYAPAAVSGLLVVVAATAMVVAPIAGVFVDRWDRRRTMLTADAARAVLVAALTALAFLPAGTVPPVAMLAVVYAVVALCTAAAQFFNPARFAYIGAVVSGTAERSRAAGIGQATQSLASIVGPPLAAPLLFTAGFRWALLINAVSYAVSFLAVRSVRVGDARPEPEAGERPSFRRELAAGLRFVVGSRVLRALIVALSVVTIGTGGLNTLNVFFVSANLHVAASWYGTIGMAEGAGAVVGALVAGVIGARLGNARMLSLALILAGVGVLLYARMSVLVAALVVMALIALPVGAINTALTPILLATTPERLLGRVISAVNPIQRVASLAGVAVAGWLASTALLGFHADVGGVRLGPVDTVFSVDGLLIVAGGLYALVALRHTDRAAPVAATPGPPGPAAGGSAAVEPAQSALLFEVEGPGGRGSQAVEAGAEVADPAGDVGLGEDADGER